MKTYKPPSVESRALAAACAVLANVLVLGSVLGLFDAKSDDAMLANAKMNAPSATSAMAERTVPPKERS